MENNTKRSKNILSLSCSIFLIIFFLIGCKSNAQIIPPVPEKINVKVSNPQIKYDTTLFWSTDAYYSKLKYNEKTQIENVSTILKNYSLKKGKLFHKEKVVDRAYINFNIENDFSKSIIINNGVPHSEYLYHISYVPSYIFSDNGGIIPMNKHLDIFKTGNGYWKEYYIYEYYKNKDYKNLAKKAIIKEEGEVKHNFKFGEWKYYNKEGKLEKIKIYTLKDSVDVRFPHCIFNQNEPCY